MSRAARFTCAAACASYTAVFFAGCVHDASQTNDKSDGKFLMDFIEISPNLDKV
jgi:hypothetical protein